MLQASTDKKVQIIRGNEFKKMVPLSRIIETFSGRKFADAYDPHMYIVHYPLMQAILGFMYAQGLLGGRVTLSPGCGTGVLEAHYIRNVLDGKIRNVKERERDGPVELICLDASDDMLGLALKRFQRMLFPYASDIDADCNILPSSGSVFGDLFSGFKITTKTNIDLLKVYLISKDMAKIDELGIKENSIDSVILSYCMYWLRRGTGEDGKEIDDKGKTIQALTRILGIGRCIISIEEDPLVVTTVAEGESTELLMDYARLVDECTSEPRSIGGVRDIFIEKPGLIIVPSSLIEYQLDAYHTVHGTAFRKLANGLFVPESLDGIVTA